MQKSLARGTALLVLALSLASCGTAGKMKTATRNMFGGDLQIEVFIHPQLNHDSPLAVELVMIENKKLIPEVAELEARDWFQFRDQFFRDHKKGVRSYLWEWVPGQSVPTQVVRVKRGTKDAYIFADYLAPGSHREQVDARKHFTLRLGERNFKIEPPS